MKKILFLAIITISSIQVNAMSPQEAYEKALEYEKAQKYKDAMFYYKKAANLSNETIDIQKDALLEKNPNFQIGNNFIQSYGDKETDSSIEKIILSNFDIQAYKTNYLMPYTYDFIDKEGRDQQETKFQISFKKQLSQNIFGLNEKIYLGYTQISWWQTAQDSAPFRETNYQPEIFMQVPYPHENTALKSYTLGLIHESNGRDGDNSRSWNRAYLSGVFQYKGLFIIPRAWYRFSESDQSSRNDSSGDDNPDIHNYLGYGDLNFYYPYKNSVFNIMLRNNLKFEGKNKGAIEFNWSFLLPWGKDLYAYINYFNGYGESLIDYDRKSEKVGIGFAITR